MSTPDGEDRKYGQPLWPRLARKPKRPRRETPQERLAQMFESGDNSDVTIISGTERFRVHRFQLSTHSKYFNRMLHGSFKEKNQDEVTLDGDDVSALRQVLRYLYTFEYSLSSTADAPNPILQHLLVFLTADKYEIPDLPSEALKCFQCACNNYEVNSDSARGTQHLADTIKELYTNEDLASHRNIVVRVVARNLFRYQRERSSYLPIWGVIESLHDFALDLLRGPERQQRGENSSSDDSSGDELDISKTIAGFNGRRTPKTLRYSP